MTAVSILGSGLAACTLVREVRKHDTTLPLEIVTEDNGDYYSKPQLSVALAHRKTPAQLILMPKDRFSAQFSVTVSSSCYIKNLDDFITTKKKSFHKIVLACGAKPVTLPVFKALQAQGVRVYAINHWLDYAAFRTALGKAKEIMIIGSGLVACEFSHDLIQGGYKVHVISPDTYPLQRLVPEAIGMALKKRLQEKGVQWHLENYFDPDLLDLKAVQSGELLLLSAVGIQPDLTWALAAGLKTRRGILTNAALETNLDNVYAIGDCAEVNGQWLPYIAPLTLAARALAKTLSGERTEVHYPPLPVYIKTPSYPVVTLPPGEINAEGEWVSETLPDGVSVRSLFYDRQHNLKGFALGGAAAPEASIWVEKMT